MKNILETIEHVWSVVCATSITDKETNNLSLINVVENLNIQIKTNPDMEKNRAELGWYSTPIVLQTVSRFHRKESGVDTSFDFQLVVRDPQGSILGKAAGGTIAFPKDLKSLRTAVKINGFPVTTNGTYTIILGVKDVGESQYVDVAQVPIDVALKVEGL
jgi:hypothetical protein